MRILPLLVGTILAGGTASAETAAPETAPAETADSENSNEILVTAQRRVQNIQEVPIAITALGGDRLRDGNIQTANDVARLVPNLTGANGGGRVARPRYFLRGVGVNDPSANVVSPIGIYVDDVYLGDTAYQTFPLIDLERVEVLRGPQGTLWGKNTIGGAINYISRKPSFNQDGYARLEVGSFNSWSAQGAFGGTVIDDLLATRVSVSYEDRGGYYKNDYTGDTEGKARDFAGRLQFLLTPSADVDVLLNVHARDLKDEGPPGYRIGVEPGGADLFGYVPSYGTEPHLRDPISNDAAAPPGTLESKGALLNVQWRFSGLTLTSITSYDEIARESLSDGDNSPNPVSVSRSAVDSDQFTQEIRLASDEADRLSWTIGGHYFRESFHSDSASAALVANPIGDAGPPTTRNRTSYQNTVFDQDTESFAAFAEGTYRFTDQFRVAAGLRWTREEKSIDLESVSTPRGTAVFGNTSQWWLRSSVSAPNPLPVNATQDVDKTWTKVTWSVTPQYDFADNIRGYLRFATGFRSGGFNGNVAAPVAVSVVEPETLTDYEAGIKSEWLDKRLTLNLAAFHYDYKNIQVNIQGTLAGSTVSGTTLRNAANGKITGVELELSARPTDQFTLRVNGGWLLRAEYSDFVTQVLVGGVPTETDASGNQIARAPKKTATLDAEYRIPLGNSGEIVAGADLNYRDHIYFNAVTQNDPWQQQGGYVLANARLAWRSANGNLSLGAYVYNLANKEYVHNNNIPTADRYYRLSFGPPRTFGVYLSTQF